MNGIAKAINQQIGMQHRLTDDGFNTRNPERGLSQTNEKELNMKKLNPIQILDLQDLAKSEVSKLINGLEKQKDWRGKEITLREIKRFESAIRILDEMFNVALVEEDKEFADELAKDLELQEGK